MREMASDEANFSADNYQGPVKQIAREIRRARAENNAKPVEERESCQIPGCQCNGRADYMGWSSDDMTETDYSDYEETEADIIDSIGSAIDDEFLTDEALSNSEQPVPDFFLGHHVNEQGITPLAIRVKDILGFPQPAAKKKLQELLGMVNFYHRFVPHASGLMQPLFQMNAAHPKEHKPLQWTDVKAFTDTKSALANFTMLVYPRYDAHTSLTVDASDMVVGGVIEQKINNKWQPLAFFSKQFRKPEQRYSAFDRELLARYLLEARTFTAFTDHKPLTFAMSKRSEPCSARQQRHLSYISEFTTDIQHIAGKDNVVADTLSRPSLSAYTQLSSSTVVRRLYWFTSPNSSVVMAT